MRKPMAPTTPRKVYTYFHAIYRASYTSAIAGYGIIMSDVLGIRALLGLGLWVVELGGLLLFYGLYFGVLDRDCAEMFADRMTARLGYARRTEDADGDDEIARARRAASNICALCGDELRRLGVLEEAEVNDGDDGFAAAAGSTGDSRPTARRLNAKGGDVLFELECKHVFHEFCIRGWAIVGKKDVCPCCSEKVPPPSPPPFPAAGPRLSHCPAVTPVTLQVDTRAIMGSSPWARQSLLWMNLLDIVRYMVVWNPVLLTILHFALKLSVSVMDAGENVVGANASLDVAAVPAIDAPPALGSA